jgi:hypothetical protein
MRVDENRKKLLFVRKNTNLRQQIYVILALSVIVGLVYAFYIAINTNSRQAEGKEKFNTAINELRADSRYDNPCLGNYVTRKYSYAELSQKSIEEIKQIAVLEPSQC